MIDTGKYTGHTPAPWDKLSEYCPVGSIDKQLIADAPLLLAEVERLREQLKEANDVIQYALEMSSDDDSTRVFEDYLEVIE